MGLFWHKPYETGCRIAVEQTDAHFHAHVELDDDMAIGPGDQVRVHGAPIAVPFGHSAVYQRVATVRPAGPLVRGWTKVAAMFDLKELYEVSFTTRRW